MFGGRARLFLLLLFSDKPKHSWWWGCSRAERERRFCATQDVGENCLPFGLTWRHKWDQKNILHLLSTLLASARFPRLLISLRLPEDSCSRGTQGLPEALAARGCSWSGVGEQRARAGHPPPSRHGSQPGSRERTSPIGPHPHSLGCPNRSFVLRRAGMVPLSKWERKSIQLAGKTAERSWRSEDHTVGIGVCFLWWSSWAYLGDTINGMFAACLTVSESCCGWSHSGCDLDVQLAFIFLSNLFKWSKSRCLNEAWGLFFNKYHGKGILNFF